MPADRHGTGVHRRWVRDNSDFDIVLTRHAREEMRADAVTLAHVRRIVRFGVVTEVALDIRSNREKIRIEGRDQNGRLLAVVVDRLEDGNVKLVTTFVR